MSTPQHEPAWRRAASCATTSCIEVAKVADRFLIRDSKNPHAGALSFTAAEWEAFTEAVKKDEFRFE
jgi:hypothetical protein